MKIVAVLILLLAGNVYAADNPFSSSRDKINAYADALDKLDAEQDAKKYKKLQEKLQSEKDKLDKAVARKLAPYQKELMMLQKKINEAEAAIENINELAYGQGVKKDEKGDVTFVAKLDGTEQRYVEVLPEQFDSKKPVDILITLHGHGGDRWQYIEQGRGECKAARDFAKQHGMIHISPDYRASTSWMGPAAEADLLQIIQILKRSYKVKRVFLAGASMGGTSTLIFTALHPQLIDGIVSNNGTANMLTYENFQKAIAASYGGDKKTAEAEYRKRSPKLNPKAFTMPVALTLGGKDESVPPDSVRILAAHLQTLNKQDMLLIDRPEMGHSTNYADSMAAFTFMLKHADKK